MSSADFRTNPANHRSARANGRLLARTDGLTAAVDVEDRVVWF
jgi:hypothetical protein